MCGPAATNYTATQTSYAGAYCSTGNPSTTPAFPAQGSSSSWTCDGTGGGPSSATCTATRAAPAAVTECNDGIDNDNNGGTDLADVDCSSASDDSELGAYDCSELADAGEVYCSAVSNKAYCETTQPSPPRAACRCTTGTKTVV